PSVLSAWYPRAACVSADWKTYSLLSFCVSGFLPWHLLLERFTPPFHPGFFFPYPMAARAAATAAHSGSIPHTPRQTSGVASVPRIPAQTGALPAPPGTPPRSLPSCTVRTPPTARSIPQGIPRTSHHARSGTIPPPPAASPQRSAPALPLPRARPPTPPAIPR